MKTFFKNNIKFILGTIIGLLISGVGVYALTVTAGQITYDNTTSGMTSTNVKDAIDELYGKANEPKGGGTIEMEYVPPAGCTASSLNVGDYVSITPTSTSFSIAPSLTGYTTVQTINPSELKLWRVIKKNDCNVEVVSEYVSSDAVYLQGITGYRNFVGTLNIIASAYENPSYTVGSRIMGYDGQTEFIKDTSAFDGTTTTAPATTTTSSPTTGTGQEYSGGVLGDTLYLKDYQLVGNVYGNVKAYKVGTTTATSYWLAARYFYSYSTTHFSFCGRYVYSGGVLYGSSFRIFDSGWNDYARSFAVRPILTLKSGITKSGGSGTKTNPYTLS